MEEQKKRRSTTSSEVKNRYNKKAYDRIVISVKKEIADVYKKKCEDLGISYSQPLHEAISEFIKKD